MNELQAYLEKNVSRGVPGCEVIVCRDHKILYHGCAGTAVPGMRYYLYSCTKPVTAAAAMIAMEQKLFSLETLAGEILPAYAKKDGFDRVTVRHLMTMSAGLDYNLDRDAFRRLPADATTVEIAEALTEDPLLFEPGTRFSYSLCHDVLAAVIEAASGLPFGEYCRKYIFAPLGMNDTEFYLPGKTISGIAPLYRFDGRSRSVVPNEVQHPVHVLSGRHYSGGAGLVSTMADYLKFADALACGGSPILTEASVDLMRAAQFGAEKEFGCTCGPDYGYGLGVRTRIANEHGEPGSLGEFGWDGAAGADILIDPDKKLSMVFGEHVLSWPDLGDIPHLTIRDIILRELAK